MKEKLYLCILKYIKLTGGINGLYPLWELKK